MRLRFLMACLVATYPCHAAWTSVGSLVSKASGIADDPVTWTTSATLEAGNIGICAIASDNDGNGTDTDDIVGVTDTAGNTWTIVGANERDPGAANAGAFVAIVATKATAQLTSGDTITVDMSASRSAKAISCWEFTVGTGNTFALTGSEQKEDVNTDAGSLTISSLANQEHLFIRAIASETTNGAIATQTTSFSVFTSSTTTTGTEASSMGVAAEFRIFTGTSLASDPTMSDTSADRASSYIALDEVSSRRRSMVVQ